MTEFRHVLTESFSVSVTYDGIVGTSATSMYRSVNLAHFQFSEIFLHSSFYATIILLLHFYFPGYMIYPFHTVHLTKIHKKSFDKFCQNPPTSANTSAYYYKHLLYTNTSGSTSGTLPLTGEVEQL
jgi:hypothetical protein